MRIFLIVLIIYVGIGLATGISLKTSGATWAESAGSGLVWPIFLLVLFGILK